MFFWLSKIFWFVVQPFNFLLLLVFIGQWRARQGNAWGSRMAACAATLLLIPIVLPIGSWALLTLESRQPAPKIMPRQVEGIVVLGGAIALHDSVATGSPQLNQAAERMTATLELARRYPTAKVLFSGGSGEVLLHTEREATFAQRFFLDQGLAPHRLLLEANSRNTYENALFSKALAQPKPGQTWLLVTSAAHMPRALAVFQSQGWTVLPYPVDQRAHAHLRLGNLSEWQRLNDAAHEWVGLLGYWWKGYVQAPWQ